MAGPLLDKKLSPAVSTLCMLGCCGFWSMSGALIKFISWSAFSIAGLRSVIAGTALLIYLRAVGRNLVVNRTTLFASVAVCVKYVSFITGAKLTSTAGMVALMYTSPVFVLLIGAAFFKRKIRRRDALVSAAAAVGVALLALDGAGVPGGMAGSLLGLLCGLVTAIMFVMTASVTRYEETVSIIVLGHLLTALVMAPFVLLERPAMTAGNIIGILLLGLLQQTGAYILYSFAIRSASALTCSVISCADPLLSPVWAALLVGEIPGPAAAAGFFIVLFSVTLWSVANARETRKQKADA